MLAPRGRRPKGRRNLKVLDAAIAIHLGGGAGTKSRAERAFERLVKHLEPQINVHVEGLEVDCLFADHRLVVEIDGPGHRLRPRTKREDKLKQRILEAAGYTVLRFRDTDVEQRPRYVLERLASHVSRVPSLHGHDGGVL